MYCDWIVITALVEKRFGMNPFDVTRMLALAIGTTRCIVMVTVLLK